MADSDAVNVALTVLYDEGCGFCTAVADWLVARGDGTVQAEPIGSSLGDRALRDLLLDERYASVHVIDARGRRWSGAASLPVLAHASGLRWVAALLELYPGATRVGYDWVTRHRALVSRVLGAAGGQLRARSRDEADTRARGTAR